MSSNTHSGSMKSYVIGFVLSIVLTLAAYVAVVAELFDKSTVVTFIIVLAIAQLLVQLLFFLHLGRESKPRLNLTAFLFMLLVVVILVFGSLWIMNNLDYNMMSPDEMETHMQHEDGKGGF